LLKSVNINLGKFLINLTQFWFCYIPEGIIEIFFTFHIILVIDFLFLVINYLNIY